MASGLVIHVEVGQERHTEVLTHDRIRVGLSEDCDLRLRLDNVEPPADEAPFLELTRSNVNYRVGDFNRSLGITHNNEPLTHGSLISDGDEIRVERSGLLLQFFPVRELPAVVTASRKRPDILVAPFIEAAAVEAAATARRDDAKVFLREFTRELIREINTSTKIALLLITGALVGGILYLGFAGYKELQRSRALIREQNEQMVRLKESLDKTNDQFAKVDQSNTDIINSLSLAPKLRGEYGDGVCLIVGTYELVEARTGRPLRYPEFQTTEEGNTLQSGEAQPVLTTEGSGTPFVNDFYGTGFHVGDGYVVTNKHIAREPWMADPNVEAVSASVNGKFRLTRLVAFFPGHKQAFVLRFKQAAARDDLAVCQIEAKEIPANIPALPLDKSADSATVGKTVVMMGYPKGGERLLTMLPEADATSIKMRYGGTAESLVLMIAERNFVKPLTSQGHIADFEDHKIIYDARNAEGSSGAPLFGPSGRVIGVNYAKYTEMSDANFAIPIRYVVPLLERAGWLSQEPPPEAASNSNSNSSQKDARATATNSNRPTTGR